jgi:phosphoenolpyruvate-protein phosphotransferase
MTVQHPATQPTGVILTGRAASPGVALAPAFLLADSSSDDSASDASAPAQGAPEEEQARAVGALEVTESALYDLAEKVAAEAGEQEAAIFEAHADFAADPELLSRVRKATAGGASAESGVRQAFDSFRRLLEASGDEYLSARAGDIDDVRDQVLARLRGETAAAVPTSPVVVVARDLTPSQTARMPREFLLGVACEAGSPTAHAAILARALGIPAVVGVTGLLDAVTASEPVDLAVDGSAGEVIIGPNDAQRADIEGRIAAEQRARSRLAELVSLPGQTADGRRIELAANVNGPDALEQLADSGAEGSGLVRTEFLFLDAPEPPDVDEQTAYYRRVLAAFPGQRVVVRTMDIGADKPAPWVHRDEENPALGLRGLRLSLARPDVLVEQFRALVRAAAATSPEDGRLAVMFPMVSRPDELDAALAVLDEVCAAEGASRPEVGVMVEVPAAALAARRLAARVDFLSLGTNDLLQYLFAADRLLADVAHLPDLLDPDVLRLIGEVVTAAHAEQAWVGVCGEAAADPASAAALVGLGVDELSMTPTAIPRIKDTLRRATGEALAAAAHQAVAAANPEAARRVVLDLIDAANGDSDRTV